MSLKERDEPRQADVKELRRLVAFQSADVQSGVVAKERWSRARLTKHDSVGELSGRLCYSESELEFCRSEIGSIAHAESGKLCG